MYINNICVVMRCYRYCTMGYVLWSNKQSPEWKLNVLKLSLVRNWFELNVHI